MDSLTQIVLGAACGEAVLGRKIGNRALLWGAIGGTIPDLDVFANLVTDEITALAFHRGIMHSLLFGALFPFLLAWLVRALYRSNTYQTTAWRSLVSVLGSLFLLAVVAGINAIPWFLSGKPHYPFLLSGIIALGLYGRWMWRGYLGRPDDGSVHTATYRNWFWLFFWSILTHPLLDLFTNYGTQLMQPFSDKRYAWNTVSVVDPAYTVPFGICLIICMCLSRTNVWRSRINWTGIVYSCAFLGFTVFNKFKIEGIVAASLEKKGIAYTRYTTNPSIFQNVLWYTVAETDSMYYFGMYSLFDKSPTIDSFSVLPSNKQWIKPYHGQRDIDILRWFSQDYYNITKGNGDTLLFHDLRFGLQTEYFTDEHDYIFRFYVVPDSLGQAHVGQMRDVPDTRLQERLKLYVKRVYGK